MSEQSQQDQQLLKRLQQGDRTALRALFDRFYQMLLAVAINLLHDVDAAKDVVQEVFLQLWQKRETITIPDYPAAYLKRATANRALNAIKSLRRTTDLAEVHEKQSELPDGLLLAEANDMQALVQAALAQLPDRCREVFVLKRMEGYSLKEIAELLEISPKTAENQMTKALKYLKTALLPYVE